MGNNESIFCIGAVYGFIVAGIFGFILGQIRLARLRIGQQNRPFDSFGDASHPDMTSARVVRSSLWGYIGCFIWSILLIITIYFLFITTSYILENII
jgi:hypothetical protein